MIAVTGMHRSGTSCITGLLEKCGYSLGSTFPLVNDPEFDNPKGHYENKRVVWLNEYILQAAGGSWSNLPDRAAIAKAGVQLRGQLSDFSRRFDGDIFKDPRTSVTAGIWEEGCPSLKAFVLCLRNPLAVAQSLAKRNQFPINLSLVLWCEYNIRLLESAKRVPVLVVDYDALATDLGQELFSLVRALGSPLEKRDVLERVAGFYESSLNHYVPSQSEMLTVPQPMRHLHTILTAKARHKPCLPAIDPGDSLLNRVPAPPDRWGTNPKAR